MALIAFRDRQGPALKHWFRNLLVSVVFSLLIGIAAQPFPGHDMVERASPGIRSGQYGVALNAT
jgi:hypothetical protein